MMSNAWKRTVTGVAGILLLGGTAVLGDSNMALIPGGTFTMGDTFNEGESDTRPTHAVEVSAFYMDKCEVTKGLWDGVYQWAVSHGYSFSYTGLGKGTNHPVQMVNWYDMVKWCNARSEKEGLVPCYYTDASLGAVYKVGLLALNNGCVKWDADGYRLPTEAEWEKAARGGAIGHRFPWTETDIISHSLANYNAGSYYTYNLSYPAEYHPAYAVGGQPYTSPAGSFASNGYGLYDMAGNVWEWCWDWHDSGWYSSAGATEKDTRGPAGTATYRVSRGGNWYSAADFARCAYRHASTPSSAWFNMGFRCVKAAAGAPCVPVYEQDFSSDPAWTTDDAAKLRWDSIAGTFHGTQVNTEGTYACTNLPAFNPNRTWRLGFDWKVNAIDWSAGVTFGLFDARLRLPYGAMMDMGVGDGGAGVNLVAGGTGATAEFPALQLQSWYRTTLAFNAGTKVLTLTVVNRATGAQLAELSVAVGGFPGDMTRLGVSRRHMQGSPPGASPTAISDYELDNVKLCQVQAADSDGDGVPDDVDACSGTPAGEVVNAQGCSISQLVPASGLWKNHGAYVSAVAKVAEDFLAQGLISEAQKDAIVEVAAESEVGKGKN